jgi:hypothetical protein
MSLSFSPNFNSGIPERKDFIRMAPIISECRTVPLLETKIFNFSTTSRKISFLRCLIPSVRHDTTGIRGRQVSDCGEKTTKYKNHKSKLKYILKKQEWKTSFFACQQYIQSQ